MILITKSSLQMRGVQCHIEMTEEVPKRNSILDTVTVGRQWLLQNGYIHDLHSVSQWTTENLNFTADWQLHRIGIYI